MVATGGRGSLLLRALAEALLLHLRYCRAVRGLGARCLDPPLLAPPLLRRLGLEGYRARRLWVEARRAAEGAGDASLVVYRWGSTVWRLVPVFGHEEVFYDRVEDVPVDYDDCVVLGERCGRLPRGNVFRVYLEGGHGGDLLRLNVVYVAVIADEASGGEAGEALAAAVRVLEGRGDALDAVRVAASVLRLIASAAGRLGLILPRVPRGRDELLHLSPAVRRLSQILGLVLRGDKEVEELALGAEGARRENTGERGGR